MFPPGPDGPSFSRYPEPPHSAGSYDGSNSNSNSSSSSNGSDGTSPMELSSIYTMPTSMSMSLEQSLYAEASGPTSHYHSQPSPGLYPEDSDLRMPSSSLSTASANSSAIGSPQSNPGGRAAGSSAPDWNAAPGMGVQPGIVSNDYVSSADYAGYAMEDSLTFDFTQTKGFVGE